MRGLRFEDGINVNKIPLLAYNLSNGITNDAMNRLPKTDYFKNGQTPLENLQDIFPDLFSSGDIYSSNNGKQWNFSVYAAQTISSYTANFAATNVEMEFWPTAADLDNNAARQEFYRQTDDIIKSFMPGSNTSKYETPNGTNSHADYTIGCR